MPTLQYRVISDAVKPDAEVQNIALMQTMDDVKVVYDDYPTHALSEGGQYGY